MQSFLKNWVPDGSLINIYVQTNLANPYKEITFKFTHKKYL